MYALSNRQNKELQRGTQIKVAIPCPVLKPADLVNHAKKVILGIDAYDVAASVELIPVQLPPYKGSGGLNEVYGIIDAEHSIDKPELLKAEVIVVTITPAEHQHTIQKIQWPGSYHSQSGKEWP